MEKIRTDVVKQIRSCLIATKGRVSVRQLNKDYYTLIGERIPYSKFGFRRLEDFIQSETLLVLSKDHTGECYVEAKSIAESAHISEMVARQKPAKNRPAPRVRFNVAPARTAKWRPRDVNNQWRRPRTEVPPRLAAVAHNQIIKHIKPTVVPSKVVVPPHSTLNQQAPKTIKVIADTESSKRHVTMINGHYNRNGTTVGGGTASIKKQGYEETSSGSDLLTKKRITEKVNSIRDSTYNNSTDNNRSSGTGGQLLTKRRITQKMAQLSLGKENVHSVNASDIPLPQVAPLKSPVLPLQSPVLPSQSPVLPLQSPVLPLQSPVLPLQSPILPLKSPVLPAQSPVFKIPSVLSRTNSAASVFSVDSNHSAEGTDYGTAGSVTLGYRDSITPSPEFVRSEDALEDLRAFARLHKLGEVNVSVKMVKTKRNRFFTCKITISDKHNYTSYPKEFDNPLSAQNHCAEEALEELVTKYGRRKSLLLSSDLDILERIPPMLEQHFHGIWASQLKLDYSDKYNEQLPDDWLMIVDTVPTVQIEKCSNDYILRHCKLGDVLQKGQRRTGFDIPDVSVPSNTVHFDEESNKVSAQVTNIMSANEIWCRQFMTEESERYNDMMGRLEIYYGGREATLKPETIKEAGYYVAKFDGSYYRIRALAISESEVHCFFIDFGFEDVIPIEDILLLRREFASAQAQAFVCRLVGLEELYEISATSESLDEYLHREVTLELATDAQSADSSDIIPVYMYDYKVGNSINEELIPILAMESACPALQPNTVTEVYISNIESNGDVYVQTHSAGYDILQHLLTEIESQINENKLQPPSGPVRKSESRDKIFLAKDKTVKDGEWRRAKLIDWSPNEDLAQIYFIDYGNADVINVAKEPLFPLEGLSEVLNQYPAQAVRTRMALDTVPSDFKSIAEKAMPVGQSCLLKIVGVNSNNAPSAEFFTRNTDGGLFCINKSISLEVELKKGDDNMNHLKSIKKTLSQLDCNKNVPSAGTLKEPPLPNKKELFEVRIPFAVNPYNFFVQPLASNAELNDLMENLQERYKDVLYSPLQLEHIVPGHIYASKHEDGIWYRTSVIKVIHSGSISVFYCDFGYYANLTVQQLIPLDIDFMDLPYQALKAKLSGIKPKQSKWTMDDCESFKQLVEKKSFYSMLLDMEHDVLYESDIVLKLILIDTSGEEDVYIDKFLISSGVAVKE